MSILIVATLAAGMFAGHFMPEGLSGWIGDSSTLMLYLLLLSVGIDMGVNSSVFLKVKELGMKILVIPAASVLGTLAGGAVLSFLLRAPLQESLAIVSGMGWYSFSGILLTEAGNPMGGAVSFLSNVFREIFAFILAPLIAKHISFFCAIAPGGATTMDTTLAVVSRNTNGKVAVIAFLSGVTITFCVPFLIQLFL